MFSLLMVTTTNDKSGFFQDVGRIMSVTLTVLFIQFTCLSIAITWIKIAGAGGKRGKVELPMRLKVALYTCEALKVVTVIVLGIAGVTKNAQLIRIYTVVQVLACAVFYYFGGKMISKILTPAQRGEGVTDEAWAKQVRDGGETAKGARP